MSATPDKRRAMLVDLRDLVDGKVQHEMACAQVLLANGDGAAADARIRASMDWHAVFMMLGSLLAEYEEGQTGKYGVSRSVTNIISAGAGAYVKTGRAA
jgi:hypothetical protein